MFPAFNQKFAAFIAPARQNPEPMRTGLAIMVFVAGLWAMASLLGGRGNGIVAFILTMLKSANAEAVVANTGKLQVLLALGATALALPVLWIVLRSLHKRPLRSLVFGAGKTNWNGFFVVLLLGVIVITAMAIPAILRGETQLQQSLGVWIIWALPAIAIIFVQATTEELIFRGYLLQQFAVVFQNRFIWWLGPAFLFGILHYNPEIYGANAWLVVVNAVLFGVFLADITIRTGRLVFAIALHFANNLVQVLILGTQGQVSGLSLFLRDVDLQNVAQARTAFLAAIALTLAIYVIYILVMHKRR